jgi:Ice-binding-like
MTQNLSLSLIRRTTAMAIVFAFVVIRPALADAQPPNLGSAETFGVLAGASVMNTGATTVDGDVGVGPGGTIGGGTPITIDVDSSIHDGDAVAVQSLLDANEAFDALGAMTCGTNLTDPNLGGQNLSTGVYCFDGDAALSGGALTLTGSGPWIFKVTGALTTAASVVISGSTQECNGSSVFWQVGGAATIGPGTMFVGNLLAQTGATLGAGAIVDGRIIALDPSSAVGLSANTIAACSFGELLPVHDPIKVTGGGQINVPDPDSSGFASYGFNARPESAGGASGHLNYLNHVSGLHVNGTVTDADVVTLNPDGSPKMVRFSGTCQEGPDCTFSVTVEDNDEPAVNDRFGIAVVGSAAGETTADRVVRNGNIQFHLGLTTSLNARRFSSGEVMALSVSMIPGGVQQRVDAYVVLRLPDGQVLSWTTSGPVLGIVPIARNVKPMNFKGVIASISIPAGAPAGTYTWLSALTSAGTMNLVSDISERHFVITP